MTKCLQPEPAFRYQTMKELLGELEQPDVVSRTATATMPIAPEIAPAGVGSRPTAKWIIAACLACLVAALAGAGWLFRERLGGGQRRTSDNHGWSHDFAGDFAVQERLW